MFPGFGHMLLSKYIRGFLLFIWEVFINLESNINLAILYTFTGRFEMASSILRKEWVLLYLPTYIFSIWDSYRCTVTLNNLYKLSAREDAPLPTMKIGSMGLNYLAKRVPWVAAAWTALIPGSGQLYLQRIVAAFFILSWWIAIVYFSKLLPCIHYSLLGDFAAAKAVVNPHWFLNVPSIYMFSIYDAYMNAVEFNNLYDWEQSKFLRLQYQKNSFSLSSIVYRSDKMHIISTFEHSNYLELAITDLEAKGIPKKNIFDVPMDKRDEERKLFDTIHHSDGLSVFDLPMVLGTFFMIFGAVYGFVLKWGPLLWGLIAMFGGFALGLIIKLKLAKTSAYKSKTDKSTEVVLIIQCDKNQMDMVKNSLWNNHALGVSQVDSTESTSEN
jgi:TM2 domain-containing membrane protein YozV